MDVGEECSKYGAVQHISVDKNSKVRYLGGWVHCLGGWLAGCSGPPAWLVCASSLPLTPRVLPPLPQGFVYLKFVNAQAATAAQAALHGRWFAGRQIAADFQFTPLYNQHFKC